MQKYFNVLRECTLFKNIGENVLERVLGCLEAYVKSYKKGDIVREAENEVKDMGIVVKGHVHISLLNIHGDRVIVGDIGVGKVFGDSLAFSGAKYSPVSVTASEPTTVIFVPVARVFGACHFEVTLHRQILENTVKLLAEKSIMLQMKTDILSQKSTREKLLLYFNYESKTANSKAFKIHYSREELADFLSLNSSAISRELSKMRDDGILKFHKNRFILNEDLDIGV